MANKRHKAKEDKEIRHLFPEGPFFWVNKKAVRTLRDYTRVRSLKAAILVYTALCEIASDEESSIFSASRSWLSHKAAMSDDTAMKAVEDLEAAGLIKVKHGHRPKGSLVSEYNSFKLLTFGFPAQISCPKCGFNSNAVRIDSCLKVTEVLGKGLPKKVGGAFSDKLKDLETTKRGSQSPKTKAAGASASPTPCGAAADTSQKEDHTPNPSPAPADVIPPVQQCVVCGRQKVWALGLCTDCHDQYWEFLPDRIEEARADYLSRNGKDHPPAV